MNKLIDYTLPALVVMFLMGGMYFFWQSPVAEVAELPANSQVAAVSESSVSLEGVETLPTATLQELFATTSATTTENATSTE